MTQGAAVVQHLDRLERLGKGVTTNIDRARVRRDVVEGKRSVVLLLQKTPASVQGAKIEHVLQWAPGLGKIGVGRLLNRTGISPLRKMGKLTDRERLTLQLELRRQFPNQWDLWARTERPA